MSRAARWRPLRILLVALGLLFLQGPRLLHLLLVAHTTCEHGELIELERASEPRFAAPEHVLALGPTARDAPEPDAPEDSIGAAHGEGAEHDHCDALALRHLPSEVGPALGAPSLLTIDPLASLGARDEQRPLPLLALAPKSSPPAA